uniref:Uncharacterized protein n=1 Tax=Lygus hesperus TaxID=30085 RepID=A0A146L8V3_LYGHE
MVAFNTTTGPAPANPSGAVQVQNDMSSGFVGGNTLGGGMNLSPFVDSGGSNTAKTPFSSTSTVQPFGTTSMLSQATLPTSTTNSGGSIFGGANSTPFSTVNGTFDTNSKATGAPSTPLSLFNGAAANGPFSTNLSTNTGASSGMPLSALGSSSSSSSGGTSGPFGTVAPFTGGFGQVNVGFSGNSGGSTSSSTAEANTSMSGPSTVLAPAGGGGMVGGLFGPTTNLALPFGTAGFTGSSGPFGQVNSPPATTVNTALPFGQNQGAGGGFSTTFMGNQVFSNTQVGSPFANSTSPFGSQGTPTPTNQFFNTTAVGGMAPAKSKVTSRPILRARRTRS